MTDEQTPTAPPARPHTLNFWSRLHRKEIVVRINGAPSVSGIMTAYSTYEIVIQTKAGREIMIMKGQILSVDLPENWRRAAGREEESADGNQ